MKKIAASIVIVLLCVSTFSIIVPNVAATPELFSLLWSRSVSQVEGMAVDDINKDGKNEIVYADWSGWVYAVDSSNNNLWTFKTGWYNILRTGDLNHDGNVEIVVGSADRNVYCLNGATGGQIWKFPTTGLAMHGNLTLVDVTGDSKLEVVVGEWDSNVFYESPAKVYVIDFAGNKVWDYTFPDDTIPFAEDVDGNGKAEVAVYWGRPQLRSEGYVTMFNSDGSIRWSTTVSGCAWGGIFFVDVNGDGIKETVATRTSNNDILIFNSLTGMMSAIPNNYGLVTGILGNRFLTCKANTLYALDFSGNKLWEAPIGGNPPPGFPYLPTADLNGDGKDEILAGSDTAVNVIGSDGSVIWSASSPRVWDARIGDIDSDGYLDLIIGTETKLTVYKNQLGVAPENHNVAITWIRLNEVWGKWWREVDGSIAEVRKGQIVRLTVIARNKGAFAEGFYVRLYSEDLDVNPTKSVRVEETFVTLPIGEFTTLWMDWDTSKAEFSVNHCYKVWAEADLSNDVDQTDNIMFLDYKIRILDVLPKDWNLAPEHRNDWYTIEWEFPDNFKEDGSTAHNHRRNKPFYAWAVWDNRELTYDSNIDGNWFDDGFDNVKPWFFYHGHGFISNDAPLRYCFVDSSSWPTEAINDVKKAFDAWTSISDTANAQIVTGIHFEETTNVADAEIALYWTYLGDPIHDSSNAAFGATSLNGHKMKIEFNCGTLAWANYQWLSLYPPYVTWFYGDPELMPEGLQTSLDPLNWCPPFYYYSFYHTAIHEIGHALGLTHISGENEVMNTGGGIGKRLPWKISGESLQRALDLYSIPVDSYIEATVHSPAHILVTDPMGRQAGYDPTTKKILNHIPYAKISEIETEPESMVIPWPLNGTYVIQLIGISDGSYTLNLTLVIDSLTFVTQTFNGAITNGSLQAFTADITGSSLTLYSWDYVFKDSKRNTVLRINTKDKYFQFIAPDKDFGVKYDPKMIVLKHVMIICYEDKEMRLIATAVDDKIDFCSAIAYDKQTRKTYLLIDKPNC